MILERFGDYTFPLYDVVDRLGGGVASADLIRTAGGSYDPFGDDEVNTGNYQIVKNLTLVEDTYAELEDALDDIRALRGTKATLYGRMDDGTTRRCKARCLQVGYDRTRLNYLDQPVQIVFEVLTTHWNGEAHTEDDWLLSDGYYLDDGYFLDSSNKETMASSPHTITVTNGGNKASTYNIITVTAGSAAITSVRIQNDTSDNSDITWTGTLATTKSLQINTGTFSVSNDGADAYSGLAVNSGHKIGPWLRLDEGANAVKVTFAGGSTDSTIGIKYWDGWK